MVENPPRRRCQHTRTGLALLACVLAGTVGCAGHSPSAGSDAEAELEQNAEADRLEAALAASRKKETDGALVVRLAFGADADLDLFVSDPRSETVYFANRRARSGGRLAADLRCDAAAPRIEVVRFEHPLPGRYRIGVDYPGACGDDASPAIFAVEWRTGDDRGRARGRVEPLVFDSIALEFELPAQTGPANE